MEKFVHATLLGLSPQDTEAVASLLPSTLGLRPSKATGLHMSSDQPCSGLKRISSPVIFEIRLFFLQDCECHCPAFQPHGEVCCLQPPHCGTCWQPDASQEV